MLTVQSLCFDYPAKQVIKNVSFNVPQHSITALVGPNGAGKTTLLSCLATLKQPCEGRILLDNENIHLKQRKFRSQIAYLPDSFGLYQNLTVKQMIDYMAEANGLFDNEKKLAMEWVIEQLKLAELLPQLTTQLSRGQKQRVAIASTIINRPKLILLDEPASGLDPEARAQLSDLLLSLKSQQMTLIVSSHILSELESYCDDMLILKNGQIVENTMSKECIVYCLRCADNIETARQCLEDWGYVVELENQQLRVKIIGNENSVIPELLQKMLTQNIPIVEFYRQNNSMQQHYLQSIQN